MCVFIWVYIICPCGLSGIAMVLNAITALLLIYSRVPSRDPVPATDHQCFSVSHACSFYSSGSALKPCVVREQSHFGHFLWKWIYTALLFITIAMQVKEMLHTLHLNWHPPFTAPLSLLCLIQALFDQKGCVLLNSAVYLWSITIDFFVVPLTGLITLAPVAIEKDEYQIHTRHHPHHTHGNELVL